MKLHQIVLVIALVALSSPSLFAEDANQLFRQGKVLESLGFKSEILGRDVNYSIYLPPDYDTSVRRYPVVYLLHGATDNETAWVQFGEIDRTADRAIASRQIPSMIIVMPDAGLTWYINDYQNKVRYEDMFIDEFIPYIDKHYRTRPQKEYRGISGLSMGGYGALIMSMRHPDLFTACAAFSAGVFTDEQWIARNFKEYNLADVYGPLPADQSRLTEHYKKYSPLYQAKTLPVGALKSVHWYLDCGDDDFLYKGNSALYIALRERSIPIEYRVRNGGHEWSYWRTGIVDGLKFIGDNFHR